MYESVIDLVVGQATMLFVELHYTLATEEAERIGVDHVARMSSNEAGESSLGELLKLPWGVNTTKSRQMNGRVKMELIYVFSVISPYPHVLAVCDV
jgi:COP9 signalosome complex subunit 6